MGDVAQWIERLKVRQPNIVPMGPLDDGYHVDGQVGGSNPPVFHHGGTLYLGYRFTRFESSTRAQLCPRVPVRFLTANYSLLRTASCLPFFVARVGKFTE